MRGSALPERLSPGQPSKQERSLFSVMGEKLAGHTTALIIAATETDAEYYALHELGFVIVSMTNLVSDSVYVGPADLNG
jgi:hypothetical protein